jgi:hypothetical protein
MIDRRCMLGTADTMGSFRSPIAVDVEPVETVDQRCDRLREESRRVQWQTERHDALFRRLRRLRAG